MNDPVHYAPLYLQVKDKILQKIIESRQDAGSVIPSEQVLARTYGTSTSTIRQAINLLVADGILSKKQGKGTFITERKTNLSFLSWIGETPRGLAILEEVIRRFEEKNPTISIQLIPTTFTNTRADLVRLISGGEAPDVAQIVSPWTTYFASMGALAPLETFVGEENLASRFPDKDLCGGTWNGRVYSVAWGLAPLALIANRRVLREAGISLDSARLELDEFADICRRISACCDGSDRYAYGLNVRHDETDFLRLYTFLQAFGGEFVDDAGQVVFDCPENIEGFGWMKELLHSCRIFTGDIYSIRDRFARGDIAFMTDGPWIKYILEELTGEDFDSRFMVVLNPARRPQLPHVELQPCPGHQRAEQEQVPRGAVHRPGDQRSRAQRLLLLGHGTPALQQEPARGAGVRGRFLLLVQVAAGEREVHQRAEPDVREGHGARDGRGEEDPLRGRGHRPGAEREGILPEHAVLRVGKEVKGTTRASETGRGRPAAALSGRSRTNGKTGKKEKKG